MRKPVVLVALLGAAAAVARRLRAQRADREVWKSATSEPDLR